MLVAPVLCGKAALVLPPLDCQPTTKDACGLVNHFEALDRASMAEVSSGSSLAIKRTEADSPVEGALSDLIQ